MESHRPPDSRMDPRRRAFTATAACLLLCLASARLPGQPAELRTGLSAHAFDHLGSIGDQAEAAAASWATVIYLTGLGASGYQGLPDPEAIQQQREATRAYIQKARGQGIRLAIGYVCATSMVNLDAFGRNWPPELRARFQTPAASWRQQD